MYVVRNEKTQAQIEANSSNKINHTICARGDEVSLEKITLLQLNFLFLSAQYLSSKEGS